jgi:excisionase family DNA binding protein
VSEGLVTARDLADLLGLSASTILDMWERGDLPGFKIGRAVRFRPSEVEAWLEGCRRGPAPSNRSVEVLGCGQRE